MDVRFYPSAAGGSLPGDPSNLDFAQCLGYYNYNKVITPALGRSSGWGGGGGLGAPWKLRSRALGSPAGAALGPARRRTMGARLRLSGTRSTFRSAAPRVGQSSAGREGTMPAPCLWDGSERGIAKSASALKVTDA